MGVIQGIGIGVQIAETMMLWGGPGKGKTRAIEQLMALLGRDPIVTIIGSLHEATDVGGLPALVDVDEAELRWGPDAPRSGRMRKVMRFYPMEPLVRLSMSPIGGLILDEVTDASRPTKSAIMKLALDKCAGFLQIPRTVAMILIGNPASVNVSGEDLPMALANRLMHFDYPFDPAAFVDMMRAGFPPPEIPMVPPHWERLIPKYRAMIADFLERSPQWADREPKPESVEAGRAWPSPRTWEKSWRALAACDAAGADTETQSLMLAGCVGGAAANELQAYLRDMDLPTADELMAAAQTIRGKREDQVHRMLESLLDTVAKRMTGTDVVSASEAWGAAWQVLAVVADDGRSEVAVQHVKRLLKLPGASDASGQPKYGIPAQDIGALHQALVDEGL